MFCFAGHSVFPEIMASMKKVHDAPKVMNHTFMVATVLYAFMGVMAFLWLGISSPEQARVLSSHDGKPGGVLRFFGLLPASPLMPTHLTR